MLELSYLLVEKLASGSYKVYDYYILNTSEDTKVRALIDHARKELSQAGIEVQPRQILTINAYTLCHPISGFLNRTRHAIREELGPLDDAFFNENAAFWPPACPLGFLEAIDGKVVMLFKISEKRTRSITEPVFDRMKRSKLATTSPSTMAQPSNYEHNQRALSEKILDDCPSPDADIAPIALLYDGFGEFLDVFRGETGVAGLAEVNALELPKAVDEFAEKMCLFYDDEDARGGAALPSLDRIFSARTGTAIPSLQAGSTHAHNLAMHGGALLVSEFRNDSAGNNTIAEVELTGYVARLNATGMEEHRGLFERWRVPSLGLTVVGTDVRFYGIIAVDHQYRLVNLTPGLSCILSACDGQDRKALYRAFSAASVLQARIFDDAHKFLTLVPPPPEILPAARRFPSVTRLRKWGSSTEYLSFQILGYHPDRQGYRLLYVAETTGPEQQTIIVKFAQQYSIELHAFCADRGFAPPILAFEHLPGRWTAIAMAYIPSGTMITHSASLDAHRDRWTAELLQLVQEFHAEGLVHGDLRDANILCHDRDVMLLDFDWGGQDGEVFYPTPNLNSELLEGRSSNDLRITKEDDNRILKRTLEKLTNST